MFSVFKFLYIVFKANRDLVNPNVNTLRYAPVYVKFFLSVLLSCFWCLAFGLYIGELLMIGYNMLGHIAIISMVFATWAVFYSVELSYKPRKGSVDYLRMPDRSSRCDELTEEQRIAKIKEWEARNVWNTTELAKEDKHGYYGA